MNKPTNLRLGLTCISNELRLKSKDYRFRTMTKTASEKVDDRETLNEKLYEIYLHNVRSTRAHIQHCLDTGIKHYRMSSSVFPLVMLKRGLEFLDANSELKDELRAAGDDALRNGLTLSTHPDQFAVLASNNQGTVANSIRELNLHGWMHDAMGLPQDHTNPINIHVSISYLTPPEVKERFMKAFDRCDEGVKTRLVLENEDRGNWNCATLFEHFGEEFPLTYDNYHDQCNPCGKSAQEWAKIFKSTWNRVGKRPVFHWSEGREPGKPPHADYFSHIPDVVRENPDITWECEVKEKDNAIRKVKELI